MFKQVITLILICIIPCLNGCRLLLDLSRTPNKNVENWTVFDPNDYGIRIERKDGTITSTWTRDFICQDCPDKYTLVMPYWGGDWILNKVPTVQGQINGTSYPVILDTGTPRGVLITDNHINKHKLPVYFFNPDGKNNSSGLAIANLTLDKLRLENYPCIFVNYHAGIHFLGLSTDWFAKTIIFPLDFVSSFSWVQYNQIKKELSLSNESFTPDNKSQWMTFPFEITDKRIVLMVPIEGINTLLFLDTGAGCQLKLDKRIIEQLYEKRPDLQKNRIRKSMSISPYGGGVIKELEFSAKKIRFGDCTVNNLKINAMCEFSNSNQFIKV